MKLSDDAKRDFAQSFASAMGRMFRQEWKLIEGQWHIFAMGKQGRALTEEEVSWHVARNHAPFVENGIGTDHPDWWKDPT